MIFIVVIPAVVALWLLVWSCTRMAQEVRARRRLSLKYCLACGLGMMTLTALFCLALEVMAALGHSKAAKSQAEVLCVVSFVLLGVLPFAGLLLYRRAQPASRETGFTETEPGVDLAWQDMNAPRIGDRTVIKSLQRLGMAGLVCGFIVAWILAVWLGAGPLLTYTGTA